MGGNDIRAFRSAYGTVLSKGSSGGAVKPTALWYVRVANREPHRFPPSPLLQRSLGASG